MDIEIMKSTLIIVAGATFGLLGILDTFGQQEVIRLAKRSIPASAWNLSVDNEVRSADRISVSKRHLKKLFADGKLVKRLSDRQLAALILQESGGRNGLVGDKHLGL